MPSPDIEAVVRGFEAALAVLSEQLAAERTRAEQAEGKISEAEKDRDLAIASHNRAVTEVAAMRRAEALRRAAGLRQRLRAAWRGE